MLYTLEKSNMTWDWDVSRKSFLVELRTKGRMSKNVLASQSDTVGWVEVWGGSVPCRRPSLSKCPELEWSMDPPGNKVDRVTGYREKSLRGAWKSKQGHSESSFHTQMRILTFS